MKMITRLVALSLLLLSLGSTAWGDTLDHSKLGFVRLSMVNYTSARISADDATTFSYNSTTDASNYSENYRNDVYYIKAQGGGLNQLHITTVESNAYGQVNDLQTSTGAAEGDFWITTTGGRGFNDNIILAVSVKPTDGVLPSNLSLSITPSGWYWAEWPPLNVWPTNPTYVTDYFTETFGPSHFIYTSEKRGTPVQSLPIIAKPGPGSDWTLPLYYGETMADANAEYMMFVDLRLGNLYQSDGAVKVHYNLSGLTTHASFNAYAWCKNSNQGQGINWAQPTSGTSASGLTITKTP